MAALVSLSLAIFTALTIFFFSTNEASWSTFVSGSAGSQHIFGVVGSWYASLLIYAFGLASYMLVPIFIYFAWFFATGATVLRECERLLAWMVLPVVACGYASLYAIRIGTMFGGGWLGLRVVAAVQSVLGLSLTGPLFGCALVACAVLTSRLKGIVLVGKFIRLAMFVLQPKYTLVPFYKASRWLAVAMWHLSANCTRWVVMGLKGRLSEEIAGQTVEHEYSQEQDLYEVYDDLFWDNDNAGAKDLLEGYDAAVRDKKKLSEIGSKPKKTRYKLPATPVFGKQAKGYVSTFNQANLDEKARILEEKLNHFGVHGKVVVMNAGPVITLFEYEPEVTTKISKIVSLEDDLALALKAHSIRIIAPIPGKAAVGFEIANDQAQPVFFADIVRDSAFKNNDALLPMILGVDTVGEPVVADLAKMPHLLIAGSTGSGKSVGLNAMLTGLLCSRTPDELKLIIIDPKQLEFAVYADIAHLLFPIVTDTKRAVPVLRWLVQEMQDRYSVMMTVGARNLQGYNELVEAAKRLPSIVCIIDELADLMMTTGKDVEDLTARIAQMARAAGIHMIVATQRPSVDVITGLIKINFPSRVAFRVTSKTNSRIILDAPGAEKLLGKGDMLFWDPQSSMLRRVHGAFVRNDEIKQIVEHIKAQRKVEYRDLQEVLRIDAEQNKEAEDVLYDDVREFLQSVDEISISLLQRKFRIGYNRSARLVERLEMRGLILPSDGGKMRKVAQFSDN